MRLFGKTEDRRAAIVEKSVGEEWLNWARTVDRSLAPQKVYWLEDQVNMLEALEKRDLKKNPVTEGEVIEVLTAMPWSKLRLMEDKLRNGVIDGIPREIIKYYSDRQIVRDNPLYHWMQQHYDYKKNQWIEPSWKHRLNAVVAWFKAKARSFYKRYIKREKNVEREATQLVFGKEHAGAMFDSIVKQGTGNYSKMPAGHNPSLAEFLETAQRSGADFALETERLKLKEELGNLRSDLEKEQEKHKQNVQTFSMSEQVNMLEALPVEEVQPVIKPRSKKKRE